MRLLSQLKLPAEISNLRKFIELVSRCAEEQGFSPERIIEIGVATEEALVNVCNYAYQDGNGDVKVSCTLDDENRFVIEIEDAGIPFDVLSIGEPDLIDDIDERKVGGLGVFIIKELVEDLQYRREDNKNILKLVI
jgi:anti-sigma regulatory factor (Ser/Thr protein kinase)